MTTESSSASGMSFRISLCERTHASRYEVCGFTTAGTISTTSEPHSFAFSSEVRAACKLFWTISGSPEERGHSQCPMFITESMRTLAAAAAFLSSSACRGSYVVGACTTSKPQSRAIWKRSETLSFEGSMLNTNPLAIEAIPPAGEVGAGPSSSARARGPPSAALSKPATATAPREDFRNRRRELGCISSPRPHLLEVQFRFPDLARLERLVPGHFPTRVGGRARHHAGQRRFRTFLGLVVKLSADDAIHKRFFLLRIGFVEVRSKLSGDRKS